MPVGIHRTLAASPAERFARKCNNKLLLFQMQERRLMQDKIVTAAPCNSDDAIDSVVSAR